MDYLTASASEAAEGVTTWEEQFVAYLPARDGDLAAWQAAHLADGWTTQIDLEHTGDPDDPTTREIGTPYEMRRPRRPA